MPLTSIIRNNEAPKYQGACDVGSRHKYSVKCFWRVFGSYCLVNLDETCVLQLFDEHCIAFYLFDTDIQITNASI